MLPEQATTDNRSPPMHSRLSQNDVTNLVNVEDASQVRDAIIAMYSARYPGADLANLARAFDDVKALFEGNYPGYLPCDTLYHDSRHTFDMTLAMARLVEGHDRACPAAEQLGARRAVLGVVIALLHDSGYMRRASEVAVENGAVFTKVHVSRSADFLARYLPTIGYGPEAEMASRVVHFTGYEMDLDEIQVARPHERMLGWMVGTADLIGQMSDRMYLEKCRDFLYAEFVWANIARERFADGQELVRYASAADLMVKTPGFYEHVARARIEKKLGGADRFAEAHFDGPNPYQSEIERNIAFLRQLVEAAELGRLRRLCYSLSTRPASRPASALSA